MRGDKEIAFLSLLVIIKLVDIATHDNLFCVLLANQNEIQKLQLSIELMLFNAHSLIRYHDQPYNMRYHQNNSI